MPSYLYKAKDASAQTISGRIAAQNQDEALEMVHSQGLVPIFIEEETARGVLVSEIRERRVKSKELYLFTKQLSGLIKSGVALLKGLEVIGAQTRNMYFARAISDIAVGVKTGRSFSACLGDYPAVFSPLYVAMIRVGEEMGHLREVLADLAVFQKRQEEMSSKVSGALVYPVVMLLVGGSTIFFILTFVMPKISAIFAGTGERLPWPTVTVMAVSHFLKLFWAPIVMAAAVAGVTFNRWRVTPQGKIVIGQWLLGVPFVRDLVLKADLARFARTMHLLLDSGLTLMRAIEVAAPTIDNPQLKADIFLCAERLSGGENLGGCLKRSALVPEVFVQILTVAEESGTLDDALKDIAESCEADVNEAVKTMTTLLEPFMILAVGLVVGFIVFAMLLPIFSMDIMAR
ncbi:MAG: type II secretion system F family protein [Candidatus Omnitrophica bacterium]|nr:type II secretion system F family protein [Candidatus Omnitrophota bacterium]